jgi:replicative DNA helicase
MNKNITPEMERAFLGCILIDAGRGQIETRLEKDDFEIPAHGRIFEAILKQWKARITPTLLTLSDELAPEIEPHFIAEFFNVTPSSANISFYENKVFEASKTRNFIKSLQQAKEEIDKHTDTDTVIKNLMPALAAVTTARNEAGIKSAAELLKTEFPEIRWIIKDLIGEGLTMFNGSPKIGKSWFALNLAIAAASGGRFLGDLPATPTDTLYLALEDTERRIHNRLKKLKAPENDNLKIATQWRDGYIGLENYLKANKGTGLVIIDTLARFAQIEDMNDYSITTNAMARLKRIADDLSVSIILIHHAGKNTSGADWMGRALGSTGLTGATDSTIFIDRPRDKNTAKLYATGRDTADNSWDLVFDQDCGSWTITHNAPNNGTSGDKQKKGRGQKTTDTPSGDLL